MGAIGGVGKSVPGVAFVGEGLFKREGVQLADRTRCEGGELDREVLVLLISLKNLVGDAVGDRAAPYTRIYINFSHNNNL